MQNLIGIKEWITRKALVFNAYLNRLDKNPYAWLVLGAWDLALFFFAIWTHFFLIDPTTLVSIVSPDVVLRWIFYLLLFSNMATWCFTNCIQRTQDKRRQAT